MFAEIRNLKKLMDVLVLAVFTLAAGCGGGGGDEPSSTDGGDSLGATLVTCIIVTLATGQAGCGSSGSSPPTSSTPPSSTPPSSTPPPPATPPSSVSQLALRRNVELEPNDDLAKANLPSFAARKTPDTKIGWIAVGTINDLTDITDAFAFTPSQTHKYTLVLCPPAGSTCSSSSQIDTLTAFFRVLDQDGNVLLTSEADTIDGNRRHATFDAGVLYYVTVDAGDTMGVAVDYRIFVHEAL